MIYGNESISQYSRSNQLIWMAMAAQAGILNMGGFLACHRFISHVTGFATYFGLEVAEFNYKDALGILLVPFLFLLGSMLSGYMVDLRLKRHLTPKYYVPFGLIFFILAVVFIGGILGYFGAFGEPLKLSRDYTLLMLLCLVCGIQNGTITSVSRSVVRTTHLTGITTDLGIGIIRYLNRDKILKEIPNEGRANLMRLGIIFSFLIGSVVSGFLFTRYGYYGFIVPVITSGILFSIMWYFQMYKVRVQSKAL